VCAVIKIFFPDNRERDIDNTLKATFDALAHAGVIRSDNQIKLLLLGDSLERVDGGAVEVSVWAL
jgi:Holliday junction resolvase RusA-like endonuclease